MKYLFIHQNFPAQYRHVVQHLASQPGNEVRFITQPNENAMSGVTEGHLPQGRARSGQLPRLHARNRPRDLCRRDRRGCVPETAR